MSTFKERKDKRTKYFFDYVYKNKLVECTACSGSGWYDSCDSKGRSIQCGGCDGLGRNRQR